MPSDLSHYDFKSGGSMTQRFATVVEARAERAAIFVVVNIFYTLRFNQENKY